MRKDNSVVPMVAVFQDCWDVVEGDLIRIFAEVFRSGVVISWTYASFICLIPEKRNL